MNLFEIELNKNIKKNAPLADKMRPERLDEFVGQEHIVGKGKILDRLIKSDRITSMVFYGPPGTGKTTLASIIANRTNMIFKELSAVTSGVKDIRNIIEETKLALENGTKTILFIDEIHRFNKSQQDALLPHVENGLITLIGATTENPYFVVNSALLSRLMIIELKSLNYNDLKELLNRALADEEKGLGKYNVNISNEATDYLIRSSEGDARSLLNSLEVAILSTDENSEGIIDLYLEDIKDSIQIKMARYDKDGDEHYNTISVFIKSMRGSDPDATLYWLAKMIHAGEDPKFIARRILILASEDIANADPNALILANSAFMAVERVGMPEARIILAQAAVYMANAPKSNSAYKGIDKALNDIRNQEILDVPKHLKDSHYKGAKTFGHGEGYLYPHDYGGYIKQNYLPEGYEDKIYYEPTEDELKRYKKENNNYFLYRYDKKNQ